MCPTTLIRNHQSGVSGTVLVAFLWYVTSLLEWQLTSRQPFHHIKEKDASTVWRNTACWYFSLLEGLFFLPLYRHSACLMWKLSTNSFSFCCFFFSFFQKPKQKDWHPPGGFILGLWALIIMVFFKTYGIKHMKHIFWIRASKMIALTATLASLVSSECSVRVLES